MFSNECIFYTIKNVRFWVTVMLLNTVGSKQPSHKGHDLFVMRWMSGWAVCGHACVCVLILRNLRYDSLIGGFWAQGVGWFKCWKTTCGLPGFANHTNAAAAPSFSQKKCSSRFMMILSTQEKSDVFLCMCRHVCFSFSSLCRQFKIYWLQKGTSQVHCRLLWGKSYV